MRNQFYLLFIIASLVPALVYSQANHNKIKFNRIITTITGDLNKDNLPDSVIVLQDTLNDNAPYRLQLFFKNVNAGYKLVVQNDSAIEVEFPNGKDGMRTGTRFSDISISAGVLTINTELLRGYYEYKFRFQNGYFALIGFKQNYSDGQGIATTTDFNLSTGILVETMQRYDTDKIISNTKKKIKINPLPNLKGFTPFSTTLY
jgi:hypothetical protein